MSHFRQNSDHHLPCASDLITYFDLCLSLFRVNLPTGVKLEDFLPYLCGYRVSPAGTMPDS